MKIKDIKLVEITLALLLLGPGLAQGWGPLGHRVSSQLAEDYLSESAKGAITALLGNESLADASTWADEMRSNPSEFWQKRAGPWHYVTVPEGMRYGQKPAPARGDAVTALQRFRNTLADPEASRAHKQLALRFSIHIVQDLHQPLHVGNGEDRGGTRYYVTFRGDRRNLHQFWDSTLLYQAERSEAQWLRALREATIDKQRDLWWQADPLVWIGESTRLRQRIYPAQTVIGREYVAAHLPDAQLRLQQAAIRTAAYLNAIVIK